MMEFIKRHWGKLVIGLITTILTVVTIGLFKGNTEEESE